jgi:hypothetical protein
MSHYAYILDFTHRHLRCQRISKYGPITYDRTSVQLRISGYDNGIINAYITIPQDKEICSKEKSANHEHFECKTS